VIEARFRDVRTVCHRRLLHRNHDGVLAGLDGDADGIDALAEPTVADALVTISESASWTSSVPWRSCSTPSSATGSCLGGSCRTRDDFDLVFDEGLVFHPFAVVRTRRCRPETPCPAEPCIDGTPLVVLGRQMHNPNRHG
jgi:hypothetical protein